MIELFKKDDFIKSHLFSLGNQVIKEEEVKKEFIKALQEILNDDVKYIASLKEVRNILYFTEHIKQLGVDLKLNDSEFQKLEKLFLLNKSVEQIQYRWLHKQTKKQLREFENKNSDVQKCIDRLFVSNLPEDSEIDSMFRKSLEICINNNDKEGLKSLLHALIRYRNTAFAMTAGVIPYQMTCTKDIELILYDLIYDDSLDKKDLHKIIISLYEKFKLIKGAPSNYYYRDKRSKYYSGQNTSIAIRGHSEDLLLRISHAGSLPFIRSFLLGKTIGYACDASGPGIFVNPYTHTNGSAPIYDDYYYLNLHSDASMALGCPAIIKGSIKARYVDNLNGKPCEGGLRTAGLFTNGTLKLFRIEITKFEHNPINLNFVRSHINHDVLKAFTKFLELEPKLEEFIVSKYVAPLPLASNHISQQVEVSTKVSKEDGQYLSMSLFDVARQFFEQMYKGDCLDDNQDVGAQSDHVNRPR